MKTFCTLALLFFPSAAFAAQPLYNCTSQESGFSYRVSSVKEYVNSEVVSKYSLRILDENKKDVGTLEGLTASYQFIETLPPTMIMSLNNEIGNSEIEISIVDSKPQVITASVDDDESITCFAMPPYYGF